MSFGIRYDKMIALPRGAVRDAIPQSELGNNQIRAASVGTLAINLAHGVNRINAWNNLIMFLTAQDSDEQGRFQLLGIDHLPGHTSGTARVKNFQLAKVAL